MGRGAAGFLDEHRSDITGRVLEVGDRSYADRYGQDLTSVDVLDVNPKNAKATIVANLSAADSIPADTFDCFLLVQTLQYVPDPIGAIAHARRILRPGGVAIVTVPVMQRVDDAYGPVDRWRFTPHGCATLFGQAGFSSVETRGRGNVAVACGHLLGLAAEEFRSDRLGEDDADYPVVALVRA
jgi:SAM-dependent methyltransferase